MNIHRGLLHTGAAALAVLLLAGTAGAAPAGESRRAGLGADTYHAEIQPVRHDHWAERREHRRHYRQEHRRDHRRHDYRGKHRFRGGHRYYAPPRFRSGHWKRHHYRPRYRWYPYGLRY